MFAEFHNVIFFTSASFQLARNVYCENQKQRYVPFAVFIQTLHIDLPIFCANYYKSEHRVMKLCIRQSPIEADIQI